MAVNIPPADQEVENQLQLQLGCVSTTIRDHYEIEYARFFNYPSALSPTSARLRPLPNSKKLRQRGGTWLSSSAASLHLFSTPLTAQSLPQLILLVSVREMIHEEHFISKLHFSWPQVSCLSQCPVRGSRVVFASYKDFVGQIQKFAMRFPNSSESQTFVNSLKESLNGVGKFGGPSSNFRSEILSQNEFITSIRVHHRAGEELFHVSPVVNYTPPLQSSPNYEGVQYTQDTILPCDYGGTCATLPHSFTAFLADWGNEDQEEQPKVPEEVDMMSQVVRYMTGSSFHDMLSKLEKAISDMEGDLAL